MIINHNITALNTHRQLNSASSAQANSMEKLSSGLRINSAKDDAAGLSISEKMRGQIRGLEQASANAQDGISLMQTAEGALNETHSILQRMNELAVQSSNGTNTDTDRSELQKEIDQLAEEITRISTDTEFNTQPLLDGKFETKFHIGANTDQNISLSINKMDASALKVAGSESAAFSVQGTVANGTAGTNTFGSGTATSLTAIAQEDYKGTAINYTADSTTTEAATKYLLVDATGNAVATSADGKVYKELEATAANRDTLTFTNAVTKGTVTLSGAAAAGAATGTSNVTGSKLEAGEYTVKSLATNPVYSGSWDVGLVDAAGNVVALGATDEAGTKAATAGAVTNWVAAEDQSKTLLLTGAEAALGVDDKITVSGKGIDVSSQESANKAITVIQNAIESVSSERSKLGAMQNRLDHTINNLNTSAENLTSAESRIRDVDMAKEMMEQTKNSILAQASQAMLAQANQAPQQVLQLLR